MGNVVASLFQLVLRVFFQLSSDIINKSLRVPKVFFEKDFEVRLCNRNDAFMLALILSSSEADSVTEVCSYKRGIIGINSA